MVRGRAVNAVAGTFLCVCGQRLSIPPDALGKRYSCPRCKREFSLQRFAEETPKLAGSGLFFVFLAGWGLQVILNFFPSVRSPLAYLLGSEARFGGWSDLIRFYIQSGFAGSAILSIMKACLPIAFLVLAITYPRRWVFIAGTLYTALRLVFTGFELGVTILGGALESPWINNLIGFFSLPVCYESHNHRPASIHYYDSLIYIADYIAAGMTFTGSWVRPFNLLKWIAWHVRAAMTLIWSWATQVWQEVSAVLAGMSGRSSERTLERARRYSVALYAAALVCFFLPFVYASFSGGRAASISGIELVVGLQVFPILAFLSGCVSLAISLQKAGVTAQDTRARAILAIAGLIFLSLLRYRLNVAISKEGEGLLRAEYAIGFWLTCVLYLLAATVNSFPVVLEKLNRATFHAVFERVAAITTRNRIPCPICKEPIRRDALVCRWCRSDLRSVSADGAPSAPAQPSPPLMDAIIEDTDDSSAPPRPPGVSPPHDFLAGDEKRRRIVECVCGKRFAVLPGVQDKQPRCPRCNREFFFEE
jgi:hypothetical protein